MSHKGRAVTAVYSAASNRHGRTMTAPSQKPAKATPSLKSGAKPSSTSHTRSEMKKMLQGSEIVTAATLLTLPNMYRYSTRQLALLDGFKRPKMGSSLNGCIDYFI